MLLQSSASWWIVCGLAYRSLGIIYGDIGTSPLCERHRLPSALTLAVLASIARIRYGH